MKMRPRYRRRYEGKGRESQKRRWRRRRRREERGKEEGMSCREGRRERIRISGEVGGGQRWMEHQAC